MARTTTTGRRTGGFPYLLVLPAVLLFAAFVVAPGGYALLLSFQRRKVNGGLLGGGTHTVFAGLANYRDVLGDSDLWSGVLRMLALGAVTVPATVLFALLFAVLLDLERTRLKRFTRLTIFLPYAVPGVIASLMWGFLYLPATSPIGGDQVDFFGQVAVYFSVGNVAVWGAVGFNMIVIYTALRALPAELFESARLDGASERQIVLRIKVPMVMPAVVMCTLFTVLAALQVFNEPNTLKPLSNAVSSTWVPLMKIYDDAFGNSDIYSAAATSVVLTAAALTVSFVTARIVQSRVQQEAA
ncbi:sugar ABC transporter permease [Streptomyces cocklensis]|jgi:multiple sugar transport system permease protein|uniref:Carbohydrate ABC transporter membrane protein 1, CUT1 family n=1 Tax=Actinacidiphila cocklensis TaxID=887465 RepID=A0A9W4EA18_9ACTN|nr:sugar ABC transporter permease [Actinacidiphila cocklensis]MDD1059206.1 sugar ABC transporter permease [Actinacidiphila cocklensis]WSX73284.1 sugar ABC transporter permease [Streptomyces sp. NBC_00899]WSX80650.1 sugar ABC transporter permease [Streptomyces sp. NBC_00899]CAG6396841.1 Carbohydrate ABC transporter membrane protein 1, CUT1 family [Actinacidiphila cocklensis]